MVGDFPRAFHPAGFSFVKG